VRLKVNIDLQNRLIGGWGCCNGTPSGLNGTGFCKQFNGMMDSACGDLEFWLSLQSLGK